MIGGFLQDGRRLGREMAQLFCASETDLAMAPRCGSLAYVVAVHPLRTGTGSLNRYPSPDGRSALPLSSPPIFSSVFSGISRDRRSLAHAAGCVGPRAGTKLHISALSSELPLGTHNRKGCQLCRLPNGSQVPFAPSHLPLVATRRLSRASSGRARVQARLSFLTATRSPVPSSVARPTWSIASATRRAADVVAGLTQPCATLIETNHRTARRSGGFLLSEDLSPMGRSPRDQEPEGT